MAHGYTTDGKWFLDPSGRRTILRGVNFGGSTKVPFTPDGATHLGVDLAGATEVSFVGRPAPLDELDRHLDRVAHWGFDVLRLLVTWEGIEHAGPGEHDEPYLDYVAEVARRAGERGLLVFVDPHQDCFSRFTGGDGAPRWTLELAGLVPDRFVAADQVKLDDFDWPANNLRVPAASMWTLFYGGDTFCPSLKGVQTELQDRYIAAIAALGERLRDNDHVLGYDSLNEPNVGYLGKSRRLLRGTRFMQRVQYDFAPWSPLEYLAAGSGVPVSRDGHTLNPDGVSVWTGDCPWQAAEVWELDGEGTPVLRNETYFKQVDGRDISPWADFMEPFVRRFRDGMRRVHPDCFVFVEGEPLQQDLSWDDPDPLIVDGSHWYDAMTLSQRRFDPDAYQSLSGTTLSGVEAIAEDFASQLEGFAAHARDHMSDRPLLVGEFGIPYEMNDGESYRTGDYTKQEVALDATYRAFDELFLHGTQWNYTPDNTHAHGDQWNHEDLSIFSADDVPADAAADDLDAGGRAVRGFCRPYVRHAAGLPTHMRFDREAGVFELELEVDPALSAPTEVYVPRIQYPDGAVVEASGGAIEHDAAAQTLEWRHDGTAGAQTLRLTRP